MNKMNMNVYNNDYLTFKLYSNLTDFQKLLAYMELKSLFLQKDIRKFINRTAFIEKIGDDYSSHYYLSNIRGKNKERERIII